MRKILFRGKRTDNKEWIRGDFLQDKDLKKCYIEYFDYYSSENGLERDYCQYEVISETVGQYTGLTDKDGTRIFEGDIVVCSQEINGNFIDKHIEIGYVEMKHGAFGLHRKQGWYRPFKDWLEDYEYEVIGNTHDNPELLK